MDLVLVLDLVIGLVLGWFLGCFFSLVLELVLSLIYYREIYKNDIDYQILLGPRELEFCICIIRKNTNLNF